MFNFDDASRQSMATMDAMAKSYAEVAAGFQSIAEETAGFSRRSLQEMSSFMESLTSARSLDDIYRLQTGYVRSSYDAFIAEATKMSDLYGDLAKSAYRPFEASPSTSTGTAVVAADAA